MPLCGAPESESNTITVAHAAAYTREPQHRREAGARGWWLRMGASGMHGSIYSKGRWTKRSIYPTPPPPPPPPPQRRNIGQTSCGYDTLGPNRASRSDGGVVGRLSCSNASSALRRSYTAVAVATPSSPNSALWASAFRPGIGGAGGGGGSVASRATAASRLAVACERKPRQAGCQPIEGIYGRPGLGFPPPLNSTGRGPVACSAVASGRCVYKPRDSQFRSVRITIR